MSALALFPLAASGLQYGFKNSTESGLAICGILVVLSMVSWTVMLVKMRLLRRARRANGVFLDRFRRSPHPLSVFTREERYEEAPYYHVYHAACAGLAFQMTGSEAPEGMDATPGERGRRVSPSQMASVQGAMERAVGEAALKLESKLSVVAMALSGAPFLGLLGTVWGVMDSFSELATTTEPAGLQAMAPGVSAALLTTIVGLFVAIPSMFGYNLLVNRIREMIVRLDNFASELNGVLERFFVDHHRAAAQVPVASAPAGFTEPAMPELPAAPVPRQMAAAATSLAMSRPPAILEATSEL